ncbi:hypothetical protein GCM10023405_32840 [Streptomonospora salina]
METFDGLDAPTPGRAGEWWDCRLCARPDLEEVCRYCGNPKDANASLPPLSRDRRCRPAARFQRRLGGAAAARRGGDAGRPPSRAAGAPVARLGPVGLVGPAGRNR